MTKYGKAGVAGRLIITAAVVVVIWRHAHWSVALAITLLTMANEASSELLRRHGLKLAFLEGGMTDDETELLRRVLAMKRNEKAPADWNGCTLPPLGWFCSKPAGHTGPCPSRPVPGYYPDDERPS